MRYYYANRVAVAAAKAGKGLPDGSILFAEVYSAKLDNNNDPITGSDGFYVPDKLMRYTAMEREPGWGDDIPEILTKKTGITRFSLLQREYQHGVNHAECLACHKPLSECELHLHAQAALDGAVGIDGTDFASRGVAFGGLSLSPCSPANRWRREAVTMLISSPAPRARSGRSPETAGALLERDSDEGRCAILIFDRHDAGTGSSRGTTTSGMMKRAATMKWKSASGRA